MAAPGSRRDQGRRPEFLPLPAEPGLIAAILAAVGDEPHELVFEDPAMRDLLAMARQIAPSAASVLITGESGTGKEIVARTSTAKRRAERPFVRSTAPPSRRTCWKSSCSATRRGPSPARAHVGGKFEEASGGTLLLDEISEMTPAPGQAAARVQERDHRVGGTRPVKVDLRLIATSNRDLGAEETAGRFREDLLFRLNVVNLHLPALRDRPADVAPLGRYFAARYARPVACRRVS